MTKSPPGPAATRGDVLCDSGTKPAVSPNGARKERGAKIVVKITSEAIQDRGRAACIAMVAAKIRAFAGKLPQEVVVSASDFR